MQKNLNEPFGLENLGISDINKIHFSNVIKQIQLNRKSSIFLEENQIRNFEMEIKEFINCFIDELFYLKEKFNALKSELNQNLGALARFRAIGKEFNDNEVLKNFISCEDINELRAAYNIKYIPMNSMEVHYTKITENKDCVIEMTNGYCDAIQLRTEKSFEKIARVQLDNLYDKSTDIKDISIHIRNLKTNDKIAKHRQPIYEIFYSINPENLKQQIIPPIYLILEFQFGKKSGLAFDKDEIEIKFEFHLEFEQRKLMIKNTIAYQIRCNEKLSKSQEEIKHQLGVFYQVFEDYYLFEEYEKGIGLYKNDQDCLAHTGCGMEKCVIF